MIFFSKSVANLYLLRIKGLTPLNSKKLIFIIIIIVLSEALGTVGFWGTWQQMLCGKVIADWLDPSQVALDPIFGVLLNPTGGN